MVSDKFNICDLIKQQLKEQERSEAWLARKVHCDCRNFNRILKRQSIDIDLLKQISNVLEYNFFNDYAEYVQKQIDETK